MSFSKRLTVHENIFTPACSGGWSEVHGVAELLKGVQPLVHHTGRGQRRPGITLPVQEGVSCQVRYSMYLLKMGESEPGTYG